MLAVLKALASIPAMVGIIDRWCTEIMGWWLERQKKEVLAGIADAAAYQANAQSDEERYLAAEKWQTVLCKPRVRP